jgi:glycosyltransferase involved in cell wall biosynthesis
MQTAIYTIAKNEAHNVAAFMKAADGAPVYVLDTGSTDNTVSLLKQHGANVEQQVITPWRFDTARNVALKMVPSNTDVCVSLDMDEVIEQGWQTKLKEQWRGNIGNYKYIAEWKDEAKTIPAVTAPRTRLHARQGFEWHRKIHEVIRPLPGVQLQDCDTDIWVRHYQDGKQRHYSGALDELIAEDPNDLDARLQRAGEMFQKKEWAKAIADYTYYVRALADDQRPVLRHRKATSWIAMAYCYHHLGNNDMAYRSFIYAAAEEPGCREAWGNLAHIASQMGNTPLAYGAAMTAWSIKEPPYFAATDAFMWGNFPKTLADNMFAKLIKGA